MTEKENRINILVDAIKKHQDYYYNGVGKISDAAFDAMWDELTELDPSNPILHKVGSDSDSNFAKSKHIIPMGSQNKCFNEETFLRWYNLANQKFHIDQLIVEYKLDGASIELQYENGRFIKAVTRGDGVIGDDITENALKMNNIPKKLMIPFSGSVRGEVLMSHENLNKYYSNSMANCRSAANGTMKRKDSIGCDKLDVIVYDVKSLNNIVKFSTEIEKLCFLKSEGFKIVPYAWYDKTKSTCIRIQALRDIVYNNRLNNVLREDLVLDHEFKLFDYDIDGLVVKINMIYPKDLERTRPESQIAFKFECDKQVSTILDVIWSRNGKRLTPVAVFEPIELNGTTVERAMLSNPNGITQLGLKIGSLVEVVKRGEIIPHIESVISNPSNCKDVVIPSTCSECGFKLINEGTILYCPNPKCPSVIIHRLSNWINVLNIMNIGPAIIEKMYKDFNIDMIYKIYRNIDLLKNELPERVILSIEKSKRTTIENVLAGLDIENIGLATAKAIVKGFNIKSINDLLNLAPGKIISPPGFGVISSSDIIAYLKPFKEDLSCLRQYLFIGNDFKRKGKLDGIVICFTGKFKCPRKSMESMVIENGGEVSSIVTKRTSYLVTNDLNRKSDKILYAKKFKVKIITESEFYQLL